MRETFQLFIYFLPFLVFFEPAESSASYFPGNYEESRIRFGEDSKRVLKEFKGSQTQTYIVDREEDLTIDTLYIPPAAYQENLFVLVSGVHGPESYAGSALQNLFLSEQLASWRAEGVLENTGVLIIHAMNPWGFKHDRRGTKNSVNLNRNFALNDSWFEQPRPNFEYNKIIDIMQPQGAVSCLGYNTKTALKLFSPFLGGIDLEQAVGSGQFDYPQGVAYGGNKREPQVIFLEKLLDEILPGYEEVVAYDVHTGLGEKNQLHMIMSETLPPGVMTIWDELFKGLDESGDLVLTNPLTEHGFYETHGDFNEFIEQVSARHGIEAASITAEFGTLGTDFFAQLKTARLLIQENQGYHYGFETKTCAQKTQRDYKEMFYPNSIQWKNAVIGKGRQIFNTLKDYWR